MAPRADPNPAGHGPVYPTSPPRHFFPGGPGSASSGTVATLGAMRALRLAAGVGIAVGITLLAGDLWLRAVPQGPATALDVAIHPPHAAVVIARPASKHVKAPARVPAERRAHTRSN